MNTTTERILEHVVFGKQVQSNVINRNFVEIIDSTLQTTPVTESEAVDAILSVLNDADVHDNPYVQMVVFGLCGTEDYVDWLRFGAKVYATQMYKDSPKCKFFTRSATEPTEETVDIKVDGYTELQPAEYTEDTNIFLAQCNTISNKVIGTVDYARAFFALLKQ